MASSLKALFPSGPSFERIRPISFKAPRALKAGFPSGEGFERKQPISFRGEGSLNPEDFHTPSAGRVIRTLTGYSAFVPAPLPPELDYDAELVLSLSRADAALSELSGLGGQLPNPHLLISPYMRREAVLSSRIEGTKASLS